MRIQGRSATAAWLLGWLACTVAAFSLTRPGKTEFFVDEIYWIGSAYYYYLAFDARDWSHPDWNTLSARENPPVAKYVIGARLALAGQKVVNSGMIGCFRLMFSGRARSAADFSAYDMMLADIGTTTEADCARPMGGPGVTRKGALLRLSRQATIACAVIASLVMFAFGASIANRATGLVASQLLLLHPVVVEAYGRAMADAVALMFSVAAAFAAWLFYQRMTSDAPVSRRRAAALVGLSGVLIALAVGSKMNALVVALLFCAGTAAAAAVAWRRGDRRRARLALSLGVAAGVLSVVVFSLINPAIVGDFYAATTQLVTLQNAGLGYVQRIMPEIQLRTPWQKFEAVSHIAAGPAPFLLGATLCALVALKRPRPGIWFVAGWWLIALSLVAWWIPFAWSRYVVPMVLPSLLLAAYAVTSVGSLLVERLRTRQAATG